jgi:hypothetical protein
MAGTSNVTLSAPTSGIYKDVLIFLDENLPTDFEAKYLGDAQMELNGIIYAPSIGVKFAGNSDGGGSTSIIARTVEFTGTTYLGQKPIAHKFHDAPAASSDLGLHQFLAQRLQTRKRSCLVRTHEAAVADHVGSKYGRQLALHTFFAHGGPLAGMRKKSQFRGIARVLKPGSLTSGSDAVDGSHPPASRCQNGGFHEPQGNRSRPMKEVITIGVDLAKNVFQVHGVDGEGAVIVRRQLRRGQMLPFFKKQRPCLVGMEACATSHHWGRGQCQGKPT